MATIGDDFIIGTALNDPLFADAGDDFVSGGTGDDVLDGWTGNDILDGGLGNDLLLGFEGNDYLNGAAGNDVLESEAGKDFLTGGSGSDTFVFNSLAKSLDIDVITDFNFNEGDKIQISKAGFGASATNQFIYDQATGSLSFDAVLGDIFAPVQFATLQPNLGFGFVPALDINLV